MSKVNPSSELTYLLAPSLPSNHLEPTSSPQSGVLPHSETEGITDSEKSLESPAPPYTIFTKAEKVCIVTVNAFIGMMSSIASPIFFPIFLPIKEQFHVLDELLNLAVVMYLLFQGLVPAVSSNLADMYGRRPVILFCLLVYIAANIGLARSNVYWLILVLRCVQAGGIAPVIAILSGMVGDFTQRHERGAFMGVASGFILVGQAFGALIGSGITTGFGTWRSVFWFLSIAAGTVMVVVAIVTPETKRTIVGNQSVRPARWINTSPLLFLPYFSKRLVGDASLLEVAPTRIDWLSPIKMISNKPVYCLLVPAALNFAAWTMSLTSLSTTLSQTYKLSTLQVGLCYVPQGCTCLASAVVCGSILNWYYARAMAAHLRAVELWESSGEAQSSTAPVFNLYQARLLPLFGPTLLGCIGYFLYGWFLQYQIYLPGPLIASAMISFCASFYITASTTLLVDLFPGKSSTSASCVNLTRCLMAAVGTAVLDRMIQAMGLGGVYTFLGALCLVSLGMIGCLIWMGPRWEHKTLRA